MRRDDRGMSLIELIIAIAISAIILGAATMFISRAIQSYNLATATINLQMESHVLVEQIGAWAMEGNMIEVTDEGMLVIYNVPRQVDTDRIPDGTTIDANGRVISSTAPPSATHEPTTASKRVIWMNNAGILYMMYEDGIADAFSDTTIRSNYTSQENNSHCISEYMLDFNPAWDEDRETLTLDMTLEAGGQEYPMIDIIYMRNSANTPAPSPTTTP